MQKYMFIFFITIFLSCENELRINDSWEDVPVVYAIMNSGTQEDADGSGFEPPNPFIEFNYDGDSDPDLNYTHFVRVQKSFLGSESAYNYTEIHDSIYYNPNNLVVWMELVDPNYTGDVQPAKIPLELVSSSELGSLNIEKDEGLFALGDHYLYLLPNTTPNATDLCQGDCDNIYKNYKVFVFNQLTGDTAYAETNIVEPIDMWRPRSTGVQSILRLGLENTPVTIEIEPSRNAKMYSISLRFNYLEQSRDSFLFDVENNNPLPTSGVSQKHVDWTFSDVIITDSNQLNGSGNFIKKSFYGAEFFTFLKSNIEEQDNSIPDYYRYPINTFFQNNNNGVATGIYHRCIDLNITAVNSELYTYLIANSPNYGLNQERPEYNNIENGIGHMSARSVLNMSNLRINQEAGDSLSFGEITRSLNFACYNLSGSANYEINFGFYCED